MKPANILLKKLNDIKIPIIIDFGIITDNSRRDSYKKMGYTKHGAKFTSALRLSKLKIRIRVIIPIS